MKKCMLGYPDEKYNKQGSCCCNCINNKKVMNHPWNEDQFKGSVVTQATTSVGNNLYVCPATRSGEVILLTKQHGMCEMCGCKSVN